MLPLFKDPLSNDYTRQATVHHSINGSFAIRMSDWKLIFAPGSGGWSEPKPNSDEALGLPKYQLYNLKEDPSEQHNLYEDRPKLASEMEELMIQYINEGRSTPGTKQHNDPPLYGNKDWPQIAIFKK